MMVCAEAMNLLPLPGQCPSRNEAAHFRGGGGFQKINVAFDLFSEDSLRVGKYLQPRLHPQRLGPSFFSPP